MAHYFTNEEVESRPVDIPFRYKDKTLTFKSDNGVFSKERVDYGSRVLLDALSLQSSQKTLLDVGCGYGTLGISLKSVCPWLIVDMVDVNLRAISLAKESVKCNNLTGIEVFESYIYDQVTKSYDVIVSNPPIRAGKQVVTDILVKAYDHLNQNGQLVIVIQKKQGAPSAKKKMEEVFGNCTILKKDKGYYILSAIK